MRFDYAAIGHVTVDVLDDGSRRAGGTAFYSALQAARLGLRTLVLTRGVPTEIEALLAPFADELALRIEPAASTTTLRTTGAGDARRQHLLAWAGPIGDPLGTLEAEVVHLAPVARELAPPAPTAGGTDSREPPRVARASFVGLTAQGLVRRWTAADGEIELSPPAPGGAQIAAGCDALVVARGERASAEPLLAAAAAAGALVIVTAGAEPNTLLLPGGETLEQPVPALPVEREDLGAGDVFAAALFAELAAGAPPLKAAEFANAAAAVRMAGNGPGAIGERHAIEARVASVAPAP